MHFLIKLGPEVSVKSPNVKRRMARQLKQNLQSPLSEISTEIKIFGGWDRLEIITPDTEEVIQNTERILQRTPGIAFTLCGENITNIHEYPIHTALDFPPSEATEKIEILQRIASALYASYKNQLAPNTSFVVRIKRAGKHPFTSMEAERFVGATILKNTRQINVRLKNPNCTINGEIREKVLFIPSKKIAGMGGLPIQKYDRVLMLISGGYDSGVAAYEMMKRGCAVDFLFCNLGGHAHEIGVKQVAFYLSKEFSHGYKGHIFTVPFENIIKEILTKTPSRYRGVLLKRMMLRAAEYIAKECGHVALITGESIAQVSSQTLKNLVAIEECVHIPVLRPLLTTEKPSIISTSEKIGTEPFARTMPEYCGVISEKPSTGAKINDVLEAEKSFDFDVLHKSVHDKKREGVREVETNITDIGDIEETHTKGKNAIIIDIRAPEEREKNPLPEADECIPFYELKESPLLSPFQRGIKEGKIALLYCQRGILSKLHGLYLQEKGVNVKVYRPEKN